MKTALALMAIAGIAGVSNAQLINEFSSNPDGADPAMVDFEFLGDAGTMFEGYLTFIDSDPGSATGFINNSYFISGTFDANGILNVSLADYENPTFTVVLSSMSAGGAGDSVDADQDGTIDNIASFGTVYDSINILDIDTDLDYADDFGGTSFAFTGAEPERLFRELTTGEWIAVNDVFNEAGGIYAADGTEYFSVDFASDPLQYTYGGVNQAFIPAPGAIALLGMGGLVAGRRRRN